MKDIFYYITIIGLPLLILFFLQRVFSNVINLKNLRNLTFTKIIHFFKGFALVLLNLSILGILIIIWFYCVLFISNLLDLIPIYTFLKFVILAILWIVLGVVFIILYKKILELIYRKKYSY